MKDAITPILTSLEMLQAYPLGTLPVKVAGFAPSVQSILVGIDLSDKMASPCLVAFYNRHGIPQGVGRYRPEHLTPILRPFSQLCQPLEDGTVPAVEVARLALGGEADDIDWAEVEVRPTNEEGTQEIGVFDTSDGLYHWLLVSISNTFDSDCDGKFTVNHAAATDYLRSKHFALPVNGRPLVEGVDFIAKSAAAATPIQEGPAG